MFDFSESRFPVRDDIRRVFLDVWHNFSQPGPVLDAHQRRAVLDAARAPSPKAPGSSVVSSPLLALARSLYANPADVDHQLVRSAADQAGDPATVEVIALTAMLAAVDGTHRALGIEPEPLPEAHSGEPTGRIASGLSRRRTHIAMPRGAIPTALDLLPDVGRTFRSLFGPLYMTEEEMTYPALSRQPGLDRAQMELVSSRTSLINECFY